MLKPSGSLGAKPEFWGVPNDVRGERVVRGNAIRLPPSLLGGGLISGAASGDVKGTGDVALAMVPLVARSRRSLSPSLLDAACSLLEFDGDI